VGYDLFECHSIFALFLRMASSMAFNCLRSSSRRDDVEAEAAADAAPVVEETTADPSDLLAACATSDAGDSGGELGSSFAKDSAEGELRESSPAPGHGDPPPESASAISSSSLLLPWPPFNLAATTTSVLSMARFLVKVIVMGFFFWDSD
jgi:hypothetical protein